jgi:hypothetical protein
LIFLLVFLSFLVSSILSLMVGGIILPESAENFICKSFWFIWALFQGQITLPYCFVFLSSCRKSYVWILIQKQGESSMPLVGDAMAHLVLAISEKKGITWDRYMLLKKAVLCFHLWNLVASTQGKLQLVKSLAKRVDVVKLKL